MKIVYIAHPIGGDVEANLADLRRIIRMINIENLDVVPFAPYYADVVSLDEENTFERSRGIKNDKALFERGFIDEVWLTGPRLSTGMQAEKELAEWLGIPIIDKIGKL